MRSFATIIASLPFFPRIRALQECFYVYRWALANPAKLGTTAQRVILAGDSAGGNLVTALALRCALENVRMPNAVFAFYPALQVQFAVSASRLLSVMDPLLPEVGLSRAKIVKHLYC